MTKPITEINTEQGFIKSLKTENNRDFAIKILSSKSIKLLCQTYEIPLRTTSL